MAKKTINGNNHPSNWIWRLMQDTSIVYNEIKDDPNRTTYLKKYRIELGIERNIFVRMVA